MTTNAAFYLRVAVLIAFFSVLCIYGLDAQCPMCRMSAETNLKNGGTAAAGLNKGIIFLLMGPYVMISTVAFLWFRNRRLAEQQERVHYIQSLLEPLG